MRGMITGEIKERSKELLGYEITQAELQFMSYIQYVLKDIPPRIDRATMKAERAIIQKWIDKRFIIRKDPLTVTKTFWNAMCELIWLAFVRR